MAVGRPRGLRYNCGQGEGMMEEENKKGSPYSRGAAGRAVASDQWSVTRGEDKGPKTRDQRLKARGRDLLAGLEWGMIWVRH